MQIRSVGVSLRAVFNIKMMWGRCDLQCYSTRATGGTSRPVSGRAAAGNGAKCACGAKCEWTGSGAGPMGSGAGASGSGAGRWTSGARSTMALNPLMGSAV